MFFVDARLDVTPETINSDNELVLSHTSPQYYAKFKSELDNEANQIKSQKVSSTELTGFASPAKPPILAPTPVGIIFTTLNID